MNKKQKKREILADAKRIQDLIDKDRFDEALMALSSFIIDLDALNHGKTGRDYSDGADLMSWMMPLLVLLQVDLLNPNLGFAADDMSRILGRLSAERAKLIHRMELSDPLFGIKIRRKKKDGSENC